MSFIVVQTTSLEEFGAYTVAFAVYQIVLEVARAAVSEPLLIRFSQVESAAGMAASGAAAAGSSLAVGLLLSPIVAACGLLLPAHTGRSLVVMAVFLPGLLLQDAWRSIFFAKGRPSAAALNDSLWGVVLIATTAIVIGLGNRGVELFIASWGFAGTAAAAFGIRQLGFWPRPSMVTSWFRSQKDLSFRFVAEVVIGRGSKSVAIFLVGSIAGLAAVGSIGVVQIFLSPAAILIGASAPFAISEGARLRRSDPTALVHWLRRLGFALSTVPLLIGVALFVAPDDLLSVLSGNDWSSLKPYRLPVVVMTAALGFRFAGGYGLRVLEQANRSLGLQIVLAPLGILGAVVGSIGWGGVGGAYGLATANLVIAAGWWLAFRRVKLVHTPIEARILEEDKWAP